MEKHLGLFYRLEALPITESTVSKPWKK